MIVYIDDILLMADTTSQAESHLKALTFLMTGLGFITNVQKSITTPTQQIEFLGLKVNSVSLHLSLPGEKLHHIRKDGGQATFVVATSYGTATGPTDRETACDLAGSSPSTSFLPVTTRRPTESSEPHQPELWCIVVSVNSSPGRAHLVAGEACSMKWQSSAVQATNHDHDLGCISPGLGSSLEWHQDRGPWNHSEQGMHINCL